MPRKYVLSYEVAEDGMERASLHFAAHSKRGDKFHANGDLLLNGPFSNTQQDCPNT